MYQMTEITYDNLQDILKELNRIIDRAKYYKDPITFESVAALEPALNDVIYNTDFVSDDQGTVLPRSWEL